VGLTLDALFVVGMNDGTFPARPSDDVLVPDRQRQDAQGDGTLPLRGERAVAMRRDYLAALAGSRARLLSYPRGNQRDGRALRPSRWALDALGELVVPARRLYAKDVETLEPTDGFRLEPSYVTSVAAAGHPMSLEDRDLRSLWEWTTSGHPVRDHYLARQDDALAKGAELIDGRRHGFTRFNGDIGQSGRLAAFLPPVLSATRLETYAGCPRRYFFERVLHVEPRPESERLEATDRMHYGSLVHRILERFVRPQIGRTPRDGPDDPFSMDRLLAVAEDELAAFEAEGRTGPRTAWKAERVQLLRQLRRFADLDRAARVKDAVVTTGVEEGFGFDAVPPVAVDVSGRQPVQFRGVIDRVDRDRRGAPAVTDYKTGSARRYKGIEADHFGEGSTIQLPVYALAAGASAQSPVRADYWCVTEKGEFKRFGFVVGAEELDELAEVVDTLTDALDQAQFPANPGAPHRAREGQCTYCPYDSVCPRDRVAAWDVVKRDPRLRRLIALVEPL
jgi:ATP-dependent helicase/nuclease subunit B